VTTSVTRNTRDTRPTCRATFAQAIKPDLILLDDLRCDPVEFFGRTEADATGLPEAGMPAGGENTSQRNVHVLRKPMSRRLDDSPSSPACSGNP
jgi:hypothetical protein